MLLGHADKPEPLGEPARLREFRIDLALEDLDAMRLGQGDAVAADAGEEPAILLPELVAGKQVKPCHAAVYVYEKKDPEALSIMEYGAACERLALQGLDVLPVVGAWFELEEMLG